MVNLVGRQLHLQSMKVNKIDRPNTTPTVRGICTIAVYFSVFRPRFVASLLFMKGISYCYKEKTRGATIGSFGSAVEKILWR